MTQFLPTLPLLVFPVLVIVAGLWDVTSYTIPNWISAALIAGFAAAAVTLGLPMSTIGLQLGIGVVGLVLGMVMFSLGWIGGGDAKLFAAAALWLGWPASIAFVLVTGMAGGALAVLLLWLRSNMIRPYALSGPGWFARLAEPGESVPYGVAIAAGALVAFPSCALMHAFHAI